MSGYRTILPTGDVLIEEVKSVGKSGQTKVAERYGVSRQAVHKRIKKHLEKVDQEPVAAAG